MTHHSRFALHIFCLIFLYLADAPTISAQQCTVRSDQLLEAPELRGFRLGMTFDQVKARVPPVQFGRADEIGLTKTSVNPLYDPRFDKTAFADIRTISFDFLDNKLTTLWIGYESSFKWQSVDEYVAGISKSLNMRGSWSPKRGGQQLRCDGFTVFVALIAGSPSIRLSDDAADETIAVRREEVTAAAEARVIADKTKKLYYPADCEAAENVAQPDRIVLRTKKKPKRPATSSRKIVSDTLIRLAAGVARHSFCPSVCNRFAGRRPSLNFVRRPLCSKSSRTSSLVAT